MAWVLNKLSSKSNTVLVQDNATSSETNIPTSIPELYPSIPQPSYPTPALPYNIMPTPVMTNSSRSTDTLPHSLDEMKVQFKFLIDSNIEDLEMVQLKSVISKARESNQKLRALINELDDFDFSLERSVVSSNDG